MKNRYEFIAIFSYAEDGISITFPDLPGCYPCAANTEEAFKNAKEALGLHLWSMENDNDEIPKPSSLEQINLKLGDLAVLIEVFMPPLRDKIENKSVNKTVSLPGWLAKKADEEGVNCSKVFQNALMDYFEISDTAER